MAKVINRQEKVNLRQKELNPRMVKVIQGQKEVNQRFGKIKFSLIKSGILSSAPANSSILLVGVFLFNF